MLCDVAFESAKYARPEIERRFVLAQVPAEVSDAREIVDLYIVGTRMRLRSVSGPDGIVYKLGHKVRPEPSDPGLVMHTSLYLSRPEFDVLGALPAHPLRKTRYRATLADGHLSIDVFHDALDGLILAEVDLHTDGVSEHFDLLAYCIADVSRDERFTGVQLASTTRAVLLDAIHQVGGLRLPP